MALYSQLVSLQPKHQLHCAVSVRLCGATLRKKKRKIISEGFICHTCSLPCAFVVLPSVCVLLNQGLLLKCAFIVQFTKKGGFQNFHCAIKCPLYGKLACTSDLYSCKDSRGPILCSV